MDLWVFGAAAAAGCIAKYCKNRTTDWEFGKSETPRHPIRKLIQKNGKPVEDTMSDERTDANEIFSDSYWVDGDTELESIASSNYDENSESLKIYEDSNRLSVSSLPSDFSTNDFFERKEASPNKFNGHFYALGKNKKTIWSKRYVIKTLSSLESCLRSYKEKERVEYVFGSLASPMPLKFSDGSRAIGRAYDDSFREQNILTQNKLDWGENIYGIPSLPQLEAANKRKSKMGKEHRERSNSKLKTGSGRPLYLQNGAHDTMALLCVGICIGVISSLVANKREVEKIKDVLKQTENLVQDLQEELEMKDSLTVKELSSDNWESRENSFQIKDANACFPNNEGMESYKEKVNDSSESMSKIEAELEAELERLGLNMSTSSMERKVPDIVEVDPDFEPDFAQGELRPEKLDRHGVGETDSSRDTSGNPTNRSGNYAVSPRALSLRLHEVIKSRLEERVMELETALQYSQRKLQQVEFERKNASCRELRYSSRSEESHLCDNVCNLSTIHPSGEPPHTYKDVTEAYLPAFDSSFSRDRNDGTLQEFPRSKSKEAYSGQLMTVQEQGSQLRELLSNEMRSEAEASDCDDEMEQELIKQIIERTKKGSPAMINAQRVLFSMDE